MSQAVMCEVEGYAVKVYERDQDMEGVTDDVIGYCCVDAKYVKWTGETVRLPDYYGEWFDAPLIRRDTPGFMPLDK